MGQQYLIAVAVTLQYFLHIIYENCCSIIEQNIDGDQLLSKFPISGNLQFYQKTQRAYAMIPIKMLPQDIRRSMCSEWLDRYMQARVVFVNFFERAQIIANNLCRQLRRHECDVFLANGHTGRPDRRSSSFVQIILRKGNYKRRLQIRLVNSISRSS